jgi:hypothetical protein
VSEDSPIEVFHQNPRHPFEDPLLLVMVHVRPVEWYFRLSEGQAVAVCRLEFTGDPSNKPKTKFHPDDEVPQDVIEAVLAYEGEYGSVESVLNPEGPIPDAPSP